ncbi:MAG: 30S ribosomal protein S8 [Kiritimatiellia bacterium]|nr:30S ribosomal protein S8 [Lentisphaerota bacterium]
MNQTDPISDMLTRIRNANMARLDAVELPHSRMKVAIAKIMKREGFIKDYVSEGGGAHRVLRVYLKFSSRREPAIRGLRRVSRPGLRRYVQVDDMKPIMHGTGLAIVSTSRGVLTDREVRHNGVGGEWLLTIW